jgi:hypothetical protein
MNNDFAGVAIVPFCTHDGYGPGRSVDAIMELLPADAEVLEVFDAKGSETGAGASSVAEWLEGLGLDE